MGSLRTPENVKLVAGLIARDERIFSKIKRPLEAALKNKIDYESEMMEFDHTDYYEEEMGPSLKRKFMSFATTVKLDGIYKLKIRTNALEKKFSENGKRLVNIDPGYLDLSKLVLFSTKDYTHRIYLKKGIFAEVTLFYRDKKFNPWPWTYPDYQTAPYMDIFGRIREEYRRNIRCPA